MRDIQRWPILLLGALLGSCASSPPTRFYTLEPVQPCQSPGAGGAGASSCPRASTRERTLHATTAGPVQVAPVHIPAELERQEIVTERGSNELILSSRHRWGAPVAEMTRRTLTQGLLQRLEGSEVVLPEQPAPANTREIVVNILRLQSDAAGSVVLQGSWSLLPPGSDTPSLTRNFSLAEQASATSYADQVQAMSRMVGHLADDIASAVAQ
jgi:uncharacterized protein